MRESLFFFIFNYFFILYKFEEGLLISMCICFDGNPCVKIIFTFSNGC